MTAPTVRPRRALARAVLRFDGCFEFLLAREPKESILPSFEIPVIGRYFPEFEREIRRSFIDLPDSRLARPLPALPAALRPGLRTLAARNRPP